MYHARAPLATRPLSALERTVATLRRQSESREMSEQNSGGTVGVVALLGGLSAPELDATRRPNTWTEAQIDDELGKFLKPASWGKTRTIWARAILRVWHDHLDEAHELVQDDPAGTGAWIHGIIHRREPDYSNARFWFRRVGEHPACAALARDVGSMPGMTGSLVVGGRWQPMSFISRVEKALAGRDAMEIEVLKEVQAREINALLASLVAKPD